jgi:DNA-binding NarL/FixJ family response regulator
MLNGKIKVMVVDDQRLLRETLERVLSLEPDLEVIAGAQDGREAIGLATHAHPAVILMDVKMPQLDGIAATQRIKELMPGCHILVLTVFDEEEYVQRAILAGADGYLLKDCSRQEIVDAIRRVYRGESMIDPALLSAVMQRYRQMAQAQAASQLREFGLSEREVEILRLVADGLNNEEIANALHVAIGTVKTHLHRAFEKIGVRDRTQAALFVARHEI